MAEIKFNSLLEQVRGRIGKLVIRRRPDGTFIFSGAPTYREEQGQSGCLPTTLPLPTA